MNRIAQLQGRTVLAMLCDFRTAEQHLGTARVLIMWLALLIATAIMVFKLVG